MNKFYLFSSLFFFSFGVVAQVQKGDSNIGINTLVTSFVGTSSPNTNGTIGLSYQKFVSNNISIGAGPFYMFSVTKSDFYKSTDDTFGLNLFINYSFLTANGKTLPYLGAQYSLQNTYNTSEFDDGQGNSSFDYTDITNSSFGINGGIKFFITERVNFDMNLSYTSILSTTIDTPSITFEPDPEGGLLQFTLGLGVIIGKRL